MDSVAFYTYAVICLRFTYPILVVLKHYFDFDKFKLLPLQEKVQHLINEFYDRGFYTKESRPVAREDGTWTNFIIGCSIESYAYMIRISLLRSLTNLNSVENFVIPTQLIFALREDSLMEVRLECYDDIGDEIFEARTVFTKVLSFLEVCDILEEIKTLYFPLYEA